MEWIIFQVLRILFLFELNLLMEKLCFDSFISLNKLFL